ncbi:MAG: MBL fold metallo-hydrolase [Elusimicrobiales bacterium]
MLIDRLEWLGHSAFRVKTEGGLTVYFDPFRLKPGADKAGVIFITHEHYDHCSPEDVALITKDSTVIAGNAAVAAKLGRQILAVKPGEKNTAAGIAFEAVAAYNLKIPNHAGSLGHTGFIAEIDGERLYHAGDTDKIPEMSACRTDIALLPVGGTYTMDAGEAAQAAALINPKIAVPMHYGWKPGQENYGADFAKLCKCAVRVLERVS